MLKQHNKLVDIRLKIGRLQALMSIMAASYTESEDAKKMGEQLETYYWLHLLAHDLIDGYCVELDALSDELHHLAKEEGEVPVDEV